MSTAVQPLGPVMLDVVGKSLSDDDLRRLHHPLTGGVILFARNYESRAQVTALCAEIHRARPGILIAVDHEGGRVQRFRSDGFTRLPAMRSLGQLWDRDVLESCKAATALGYVLAAELRACGVDLSFTPVLDLDYGPSEVIGDRAFHRDPRVVTMLAKNINHGLLQAGMANCGKHFPGHGWAEADSHVAIPVDERPLNTILQCDAKPYEWLDLSLAAVMPAHVIYPKVDSLPAGFSRVWLQTILRQQLAFEGVIFSDDLSMEGASVAGDVVKGAELALSAGCDAVLICNRPDLADQLIHDLRVSKAKLEKSAIRLNRLMPTSAAKAWAELQAEKQYQRSKACLKQHHLIE